VVFIEGALPGEWVRANVHKKKNNWESASLVQVWRESSQRVRPPCPHFGLHAGACGGCKMQHLHPAAQVAIKQRVLQDNLWHLAKVRPEQWLRPIHGPSLGYRWRARLSVRHVIKKGTVLIGFHERKSRYIADMQTCKVLPPWVDALLLPLRDLIARLDVRDQVPQLELAVGDNATALVLRHLVPLTDADRAALRAFAQAHPAARIQWWLQPKGPDTAHVLDETINPDDTPTLYYTLREFDVVHPFKPTDFTQVNPHINCVLVSQALRLLDAKKHERVLDWFCGLGNFTLPLATQAASVLGIEGSPVLVQRAQANWRFNQKRRVESKTADTPKKSALAATEYVARDLFEMTPEQLAADGSVPKWLVDPPREGAFALCKALAALCQDPALARRITPAWQPPQRIVYVSCNPATLARDAGLLVHQAGYRCTSAGVVNMFAHTAHVESTAVFERTE
jgi:23S rRNA (uracil1939-C5)-methyltransferase